MCDSVLLELHLFRFILQHCIFIRFAAQRANERPLHPVVEEVETSNGYVVPFSVPFFYLKHCLDPKFISRVS